DWYGNTRRSTHFTIQHSSRGTPSGWYRLILDQGRRESRTDTALAACDICGCALGICRSVPRCVLLDSPICRTRVYRRALPEGTAAPRSVSRIRTRGGFRALASGPVRPPKLSLDREVIPSTMPQSIRWIDFIVLPAPKGDVADAEPSTFSTR